MAESIRCGKHGSSETTYVCPHILQTVEDHEPRGFNWIRDDDDEIQAFCDRCWNASDEEWEKQREEGPKLLCLQCLIIAAELNGVEMDLGE